MANEWQRLHPLTPLLRGGRVLVGVLIVAAQGGITDVPAVVVLTIIVAVFALALLGGWLSWRATRYRLTATELQVDTGVLRKQSRRVPLARLQAVDVVRPLQARVFALAELRLEVVGGDDTEAPLSFLREEDAHTLRAALLARAAGRAEEAPEPEAVLVVVPTGVLIASLLLGGPAITVVVVLVALLVGTVVDLRAAPVVLGAAVPAVLGIGAATVRRLLVEYGSTVSESPDGLRLRSGLLDTRSATIPPGRVVGVRVLRPLLWRPFGWVRVEVDVAGYAAGGEQTSSALLPVAPEGLALALVDRVLGDLPAPGPLAPRRARLRAPLSARRLRVAFDERHLVSSYGVLTDTTDVVPLAALQSVRWSEGPWQRRLRLATIHVDTAGRRLPGASARHRDAGEAARLFDQVVAAARAARSV